MIEQSKRKNIDLLIDQFRKKGYMTVSRKFGTYLPEPSKVGGFDVDIVARIRNNYAIGITLSDEDFNDTSLISRITYLASRQTKYGNKKVPLFVGVPDEFFKSAKIIIDSIPPEIQNNIKLVRISEKSAQLERQRRNFSAPLFS